MGFFMVAGLWFHIWPDDGSFEPKHVAEFVILVNIYIYCCIIDWNKLLYYCNTQRDGSCQSFRRVSFRNATLCLILCQRIRLFVNIHANISIIISIFNFYLPICFVRNKADILSEEVCDLFLSVWGGGL